ncbi:MAG: 4Fe-4S binding protein [Actinobacteria bacterium]|nr:4Fe-4S binding protein [Actinomycetota bacterium]
MAENNGAQNKTVVNIFLSPSGSTRKTGRLICSFFKEKGYSIIEFDLAKYRGKEKEIYDAVKSSTLLLAGSPVYAGNALSPVISFLNKMPQVSGKSALAYVTYGTVSKGDSLYQLADVLNKKGFKVLGLAAIVAEHSMMFKSNSPFGKGRPGDFDINAIKTWMDSILPLVESGTGTTINYSTVKQQQLFGKIMQATAFRPELHSFIFPPVSFREENCNSCGACMEVCPSGRLDNLPRINKSIKCLHCYQCIKVCKEGAVNAPVWLMPPVLHVLARISRGSSEPETTCYL